MVCVRALVLLADLDSQCTLSFPHNVGGVHRSVLWTGANTTDSELLTFSLRHWPQAY
jgi:hypothetical protein